MTRKQYILSTALANLGDRRLLNLVAVGTTAVALLVVGALLLTHQNLTSFLNELKSQATVSVHLQEGIDDETQRGLRSEIVADQRVESVEYVSPEAAMDRMEEMLGEDGEEILAGLDSNPLPATLEVSMQPEALSEVDQFVDSISDRQGVYSVNYGQAVIQQLETLSQLLQGGLLFVAAVITIVALVVVFNTIQLAVVSREKEIGILQLVGATRRFIAAPFVIGGLIHGLVGSLVALGMLWGMSSYLAMQLSNIPFMGIEIEFLSWLRIGGLVVAGTVLGGLASVTAVYRTLRTL